MVYVYVIFGAVPCILDLVSVACGRECVEFVYMYIDMRMCVFACMEHCLQKNYGFVKK